MKRLYIVGNGFDLYHGMKTTYHNFKSYLREHRSPVYESVEKYIGYDYEDEKSSVWNKFEENLKNLEEDTIIEECRVYLIGYGEDEWSDSAHHDFQYCIDSIKNNLTSGLLDNFTDWIKNENFKLNQINRKLLLLDDSLFLSFNYTMLLEEKYGIKSNNILHIHNSVEGGNELILGHNYSEAKRIQNEKSFPNIRTKSDIDELLAERGLEEDDVRYREGKNIIRSYYGENHKNSMGIIERNKDFFESLDDVESIHVIGHSMSEVDIDYFDEITKKVNKDVQWNFTWHTSEDKENIECFIKRANINQYRLGFISDYEIRE